MNSPIVAREIMVTRLVTLGPGMDLFQAIGLLLKHKISGASVVDEQRNYLGVFSERCCMSAILKSAHDGVPTARVENFMDTDAPTITEETDLLSIAQEFLVTHARRLPVLRDGKLVGQISRRDVLRATHNMMAHAPDREAALLYLSSLMDRAQAPIA